MNNSTQITKNILREPSRSSGGRFISRSAVSNIDPRELLQLLKEINGYSYNELGREFGGYGKGYICDVFHGRKIPEQDLQQKIAEFFRLPVKFIWKF